MRGWFYLHLKILWFYFFLEIWGPFSIDTFLGLVFFQLGYFKSYFKRENKTKKKKSNLFSTRMIFFNSK